MVRVIFIGLAIAFVVAAVQGAAIPAELQEPAKMAHDACTKETGVGEDVIAKTANGEFADDRKLKCYYKCLMDKFELIEDGTINFAAMAAIVPESIADQGKKMVEKCSQATGADLCEQSYNFHKCAYESFPEIYFVV